MNKNARKLRDWADERSIEAIEKTSQSERRWGSLKDRFPKSFARWQKLMRFRERVKQNRDPKI